MTVELLEGPTKGKTSRFTILGSVGSLAIGRGDHIRVYENKLPPGAVSASGHKVDRYSFSDFGRRGPMLWLAIAFAVMLVTMPLSYGLGAKMISAWLGTAVSLVLAAGLASTSVRRSPVSRCAACSSRG